MNKEKEVITNLLNGGNGNSSENSNTQDFQTIKKVNGCTIDIQIPLTNKAKEESQTTDFANVVETMIDEDDLKSFNVVMMIIFIL